MKRARHLTLLIAACALALCAQESSRESPHEIYWKWANFALLVGALGYLIAKYAPAFFAVRTEQIRRGIDEAAKLKQEAEARAAAMEQRMANLGAEIEAVRREGHAAIQAESERVQAATAGHLAKIRKQAEQEVVSLTSQARQELKAFAAELAVNLAAERIRARMTEPAQDTLADNFVQDLQKRFEKQGTQN
ncbi:MAG: hypothetical protein ABI165_14015 [Bryobacteraceae bacterium]